MHQRSCRVIKDLEEETFESHDSPDNYDDTGQPDYEIDLTSIPSIKPGIRLPHSDQDWKIANDYFVAAMPISEVNNKPINIVLSQMNSIIYEYFFNTFGPMENSHSSHFVDKYKDYSKSLLKSTLKVLKSSNGDLNEIKYVAKCLRVKLHKDAISYNSTVDHDKRIQKNFWGYVKQHFKQSTSLSPTFDSTSCTQFFRTFFRSINPSKSFQMPSWIPALDEPSVPYDISPPSYHQVTKTIRRMKASGSPCPLDKISIIAFKRCPFLRSYITAVFNIIWLSGEIPSEWKRACTVLAHKKGDTSDPANFRPITLESVPLKIFSSCLRDSIFAFVKANGFIEHQIQKGFLPKLTGTFEHTAQMANVINTARIKQKSLVITILDLKNAFGEVHHNLIPAVLRYHHIPDHIQLLIRSLYSNFQTSIITDSFQTPFIKVGRGVLQGDSLSPLTFNLCFNTFIHYISEQKFKQFGFSASSLLPIHWFQFADDAAVITGLENENQILLNHFTRWCTWANMIIRVDKCSTFGIRKSSTASTQYLPKLLINQFPVPTVAVGNSFKYLGRYFNFSMDNIDHMSKVLQLITGLMRKIDEIPCHPKNKLLLYHRFVLSKISWHFTIADLGKTWVSENIDNLVSKYIRQWLELPICATLSTLVLSKSKYDISLILPSTKFAQCQVVMRNALKSSPNTDINALWSLTSSGCNIQYDQYRNTTQVLTAIRDDNEDRIRHELKSQGFVLSSILLQGSKHTRHLWTKVHCNMPRNIFNFIVKYINNTLPTKKNLCKWSLSPTSACSFCFQSETLQHVVPSCKSYLQDGRYTWRHNSVLLHLAKTLSSVVNSTLYAVLPFFPSPSLITGDSLRPDLVLVSNSSCVYLLEVTVGFESNIQINSDRKATKYLPLIADLQNSYSTVKLINLSMSALEILGTSSESFPSMLRDLNFDDTTKHKILSKTINIAVRCTYYIFCRRNKPWTNPNLLDY